MKKSKTIRSNPKSFSLSAPSKNELEYEKDFSNWTKSQAKLLRNKKFLNLDIDNLIEEIESLGKSEKRVLLSHVIILLLHLLKRDYQSKKHTKSWDDSIENARVEIDLILLDSPSFKRELPIIIEKAYKYARKKAIIETGLEESMLPDSCPWKAKELF